MASAGMLAHERAARRAGARRLAGVDEAGRGPLAGPVVAAAVVFSWPQLSKKFLTPYEGLTDSKKLTPRKRELFFAQLQQDPRAEIGVAIVEAEEVDAINILKATHAAMARALNQLSPLPELALIDGLPVPGLPCDSQNIIKGDAKSLFIAAASIIAKVTRDRIMVEMDQRYPEYGFAKHKGYGTKVHLAALREHGPCPTHRHSFRPVRESTEAQLFPR